MLCILSYDIPQLTNELLLFLVLLFTYYNRRLFSFLLQYSMKLYPVNSDACLTQYKFGEKPFLPTYSFVSATWCS